MVIMGINRVIKQIINPYFKLIKWQLNKKPGKDVKGIKLREGSQAQAATGGAATAKPQTGVSLRWISKNNVKLPAWAVGPPTYQDEPTNSIL